MQPTVAAIALFSAAVSGAALGAWLARPEASELAELSRQLEAVASRVERLESATRTAADAATPEEDVDLGELLAGMMARPEPNRREPGGRAPDPAGWRRGRFGAAGGPLGAEAQRLLDRDDPEGRLAAARELRDSRFPPLRLMSAQALLELDPEEGIAAVQEFVDQAGSDVRSQRLAAAAIGLLGDLESYEVDALLYEYYEGDNPRYRRAAAQTLEARGDVDAMNALVASLDEQLRSPDGGIRSRAAQALGRTRSPAAVESLVAALDDANSEVRLRALQALGRTADESVIPELVAMLDDPVAEVRSTADQSIDRIRNPRPAGDRFWMSFGLGSAAP